MLIMVTKDDSTRSGDLRANLSDEEIGKALRAAREAHGWSQMDMGKRMGEFARRPMSGQAYARYEGGGHLKPRDLADACKALSISADELEDYLPANIPLRREVNTPPKRGAEAIPAKLYGTPRIVAGQQILERSSTSVVVDLSAYLTGALSAVQTPDDTMSPMVQQGQLVFFDVNSIAKRGDLAVVETADGKLIIRLLAGQDGSTMQLTSLWPETRTLPIPMKDVVGLYQVRLRAT